MGPVQRTQTKRPSPFLFGLFLFCNLAISALGCGDDDTLGDASIDGGEAIDSDGDFLCDATERMRGSDPSVADTDGDRLSDWAEFYLGTDPQDPNSPNRQALHILREEVEASITVEVARPVNGQGEDFVGAFQSTGALDSAGQDAGSYFATARAAYGAPEGNYDTLVAEEQSFQNVVGETLLGFELFFQFGSATARGCAQGHRFAYNIKRTDGSVVGSERGYLMVLPEGMTLAEAAWCPPTRGCL